MNQLTIDWVYERHYCLGSAQTREVFDECGKSNLPLAMYVLEIIETTENIQGMPDRQVKFTAMP